jgi:general secretion pathway protein L
MTLEELLNREMDFGALAALARRGFDWWTQELAAMLPPAWRGALASGPRTWAEPGADGVWRFWKDGRPMAGPPPAGGARIGVLLPAGCVLTREIRTPRMPAADVRRMLALDIDRLSPLAPELIHFDMAIIDRDSETPDGGQRVLVGIVQRTVAGDLWARARAQDLTPAALAARTRAEDADGEAADRRFNFLPAVLAASGQPAAARAPLYWWGAVAGLLLVNLAVLVGRDMLSVQRLADLVEAQRPAVTTVQALRARVEAENRRRLDLVARAQRNEPLRVLNALTQALPANTWIQRLEWNGQTLHVTGDRGASIDIAAAIRGSGLFTNPRAAANTAPGGPQGGTTESRPYDVTADARPDPRSDAARTPAPSIGALPPGAPH